MNLEIGKVYVTADGRTTSPLRWSSGAEDRRYPYCADIGDLRGACWNVEGKRHRIFRGHGETDLVAGYAESHPDTGANPKDALGLKKPPLRLNPAAALLYMSRVFGLGAKKYGPYNWRTKKVNLTVYLEAAQRHILSKLDGENLDPESGQPHEAHAMACMAILLDALATGNLIDDRPPAGAAARLILELTEK